MKPSVEAMQVVESYVREFRTPLVPLDSLYRDLESDHEMNRICISHCLIRLEHDDRVWMLHVSDEADEQQFGLPIGGYAYVPYDGLDEPL